LYLRLVDLFSLDLSVVFYDTTLVSYEGEGAEGLMEWSRQKSYDFLLGLALTRDGIPFAHEVMPGNTADSTTLKAWVENIRARFGIKRCIICADRGIVTWENLGFLEEEKIPYLVGMPLRKFKEVKEGVLSTGGRYREVADNLLVKETEVGGVRYLICFNPKEAERRKAEREELIQRLEEEIQSLRPGKEGHTKRVCSLLSHRVWGKYLREQKSGELVIDRGAVREEARYDGKFVLRTSDRELEAEDLALAYKELVRIEHSFRSIKSFVEIAPVYHWVGRRVRAHVFVCVLAHLLERLLERELKRERAGSELSVARALEALGEVQAVDVLLQGRGYRLATRPPEEAREVF
ncbi:MAG TPA: IS1634 family transposase, partial [Anaerolineae bacterium]|nr:IS1634 family transposase [Anaerolineae bacterium]